MDRVHERLLIYVLVSYDSPVSRFCIRARLSVPVFVALGALTLSGCFGVEESQPGYEDFADNGEAEYVAEQDEARAEAFQDEWGDRFESGDNSSWLDYEGGSSWSDYTDGSTWSCRYAASYDYDFYNDVVCRRGSEVIHPRLREWDDFVEEWEMRESIAEYEAELNAGG